jgi:hypothetical protein
MDTRRPDPIETPEPPPGDKAFTGSSTLLVMLIVFGLLAVMSLLSTMRRPEHSPRQSISMVAYRPADFPSVFAEDPLEGLDEVEGAAIAVEPPPFNNPDDFPCSQCHEGDPGDPTRRPMRFYHEEIVLNHDEEHRWCLDCHTAENRDVLHAADMTPIPFEESYRLCGQCHGTQYRDWRAGAHGRRTGYWDGPQRYLLCVHCHNPHSPAFEPMTPLPPPVMPAYLRDAQVPAGRVEGGER